MENAMSRFAWSDQVTTISSTLRTLEQQVADGERDAPGLEDLKAALDDLRLRAWGLLMATNEVDYSNFQERFRIRRTKEMCTAMSNDIRSGKMSAHNPELPGVGQAAREVALAVEQVGR
jgi:hypothetical protein